VTTLQEGMKAKQAHQPPHRSTTAPPHHSTAIDLFCGCGSSTRHSREAARLLVKEFLSGQIVNN